MELSQNLETPKLQFIPQTKLQFITGLQVDDNFFEFATRDSHEKALELAGWARAGGWPDRDWLIATKGQGKWP